MSQLRAFPAVLTGVALLSLACSGSVGDDGQKGGAAAGSGVGGTSGSGGKGTGGTGNTSGSGGGPTAGVAPLTRVARLTHNQYQNTAAELFGITDRPTDAFAPDAANGFGFDTSVDFRVDGRLGGQYRTAAELLAARVVAEPSIYSRVVPCTTTDAACQGQFIASFGERAFRRPLLPTETTRFTTLFAQGATLVASGDAFRDGVQLVVEAMLQSPQFLYRTELSSVVGADGLVALDDWEIASRLSYLAWDSMPDTALFTAARQGMLHTPDQVSAAAARILAEPRALAKMVSFHEQAWRFSEYSRISPDRMTYPNAPANLVELVYPATTRFVENVVQGGGGLTELLTAPYAYADSALAPLYGTSVSGGLARIELDPNVRKGILMQVGHLASHAYAIKTDPIHRGLFVLRDVLCRVIPDPPAGASMTPLPPTTEPIETTREEISLLTGQDDCIGCHVAINAPGFAFENFDATGQIRTMEGGVAVDTTGELELDTGALLTFRNAVELVDGLAASSEAQSCYVAKWLEFSYGRQFASNDQAVRTELSAQPLGARAIATRITTTPAFLMRAPNEVGP